MDTQEAPTQPYEFSPDGVELAIGMALKFLDRRDRALESEIPSLVPENPRVAEVYQASARIYEGHAKIIATVLDGVAPQAEGSDWWDRIRERHELSKTT